MLEKAREAERTALKEGVVKVYVGESEPQPLT